ncbi:tetratricopeptide repeat protein [Candidatus Woesearchaeota archaeon]|nr:tetratricopeptide repeat protein [Candidatus Woesearchaeota archaeon]
MAYIENGEYGKSIGEFNALIKLNPNYYLPYEGLGKAYFELGDYEKAESNLRKSLKLNPSSGESKKLLLRIETSQ